MYFVFRAAHLGTRLRLVHEDALPALVLALVPPVAVPALPSAVPRRGVVEAEGEVDEAECDADVEDDDDAEGGVRDVGHAAGGVR